MAKLNMTGYSQFIKKLSKLKTKFFINESGEIRVKKPNSYYDEHFDSACPLTSFNDTKPDDYKKEAKKLFSMKPSLADYIANAADNEIPLQLGYEDEEPITKSDKKHLELLTKIRADILKATHLKERK